jgi:hypothetical protein
VMGAWVRRAAARRKLQNDSCVHLAMESCITGHASHAKGLCSGALASGQWRAMPDGIDGINGNGGNVVSVTYRF